jgi:hypothetical protein
MMELDFPTKLMRLTKAALKTVKCCVKILNDCLDPFETGQRLRQRDVLSTLIFNVVLDSTTRKTTNDGHHLQQCGTLLT